MNMRMKAATSGEGKQSEDWKLKEDENKQQ
jgi:hypothetical protein